MGGNGSQTGQVQSTMKPEVLNEWVTLYHGDCLPLLEMMQKVSAVITDPPYGINLENHSPNICTDGSARRRLRSWSVGNDHSLDVAMSVIDRAEAWGIPIAAFASPYVPLPGEWRNILVWDKGPAVGGGGDTATCWKRTFEMIYIRGNRPLNGKRDEAVCRFHVNTHADFEYHPCQKPVPLLRYLIKQLTNRGDTILDPFAGSGSAGIAAMFEKRKCVLIERDPAYCDIIRRRIAEADLQEPGNLFAGRPDLFEGVGEQAG